MADFVAVVQSPERLRLLLVLTVADIRAVGPGRWNGWKGQLLRDLYHAAEAVMTGGQVAEDRGRRAAVAKHAFATASDTSGTPVLSAALDGLDDAYWLSAATEIHVRHAHLLRKRLLVQRSSEPPPRWSPHSPSACGATHFGR